MTHQQYNIFNTHIIHWSIPELYDEKGNNLIHTDMLLRMLGFNDIKIVHRDNAVYYKCKAPDGWTLLQKKGVLKFQTYLVRDCSNQDMFEYVIDIDSTPIRAYICKAHISILRYTKAKV